jgi:hypothetical protein
MRVIPIVAVLSFAGVASAQWSDNFNRPDGPLGPDWNVISGTWAISGNQGTHTSTAANELIQHASASLGYASSVSSLDVFATVGGPSQFSGLVIGLGGTDAIMVKIQDQVTTPEGFSHIGIYHRTSATGWGAWTTAGGLPFSVLTAPFASGRLTVSFPNPDTLLAEIDTDFNGVPDQTYMSPGVLSFAANMGTGFGIAAWGNSAKFDNFNVVPVPGTLALLGLGGLVAARRRR